VTRSAKGLLPGQRFDTYYRVHPNTAAVVVRLYGVEPGVVQNQFFGDDILLSVHSAKTSAIGEGDYPVLTFTTGGTYVIPSPERGLMRVTLNGDWTNASPIDATVSIVSVTEPVPGLTTQGRLDDGQVRVLPFAVPPGAAKLSARLEWQGDWSSYPANDVDLILVQPDGSAVTKNGDRFQLRIAVGGEVLKWRSVEPVVRSTSSASPPSAVSDGVVLSSRTFGSMLRRVDAGTEP
jgi:hypothetical protein